MKEINQNLYVDGDMSQTVSNIIDYICEKDAVRVEVGGYTLETHASGHRPHNDWGNNNQMPWCKYSASVLLTIDYDGGEFSFVDNDDSVIETIDKFDHYRNVLIYDVNQRHQVLPHTNGERTVFLVFFQAAGDPHTGLYDLNSINQEPGLSGY